ncbi:hypothetical protein ACWGKO_16610 [Streptomyces griseoincarnatus]
MASAVEAPATVAEGQTSHTQIQLAGLAKLREDFPPEQIQKLPRLKCPQCRDSRNKVCENPRHAKSECKECGNFVSVWHLHLDYVGHAELTNRLLEADPLWSWEPLAFDQRGLPAFDENGGLWIRLTVCGHTRLGYGDSQGKRGPNAVKEAIGDALRNAAMRFGAALDLWAKSDLREAQTEHPKTAEDDGYVSGPERAQAAPAQGNVDHLARLRAQALECWNNAMSLAQIVLDAEKHGVADADVPLKNGSVVSFRELLNGQINALDRSAA